MHVAVQVVTIEPAADLPDQVFSANCGLVHGRSVYLSSYAHPERRPERAHYERWFRAHGFRVAGVAGGEGANEGLAFEGTGDALFAVTTLVGGHGFRTSPAVYAHVLQHLNAVPADERCGTRASEPRERRARRQTLLSPGHLCSPLLICFVPKITKKHSTYRE